jgi:hypothetical protein
MSDHLCYNGHTNTIRINIIMPETRPGLPLLQGLKLVLEKGAMSDQAVQRALEVKRRHEQELLRQANVVAVGVGYGRRGGVPTREVCIVVSVKNKVPLSELTPREVIPAQIEGVPVDVVETGEIRAL